MQIIFLDLLTRIIWSDKLRYRSFSMSFWFKYIVTLVELTFTDKMIVNGTCINITRTTVGSIFINVWTGVSSLVAVIWLGRSMYKQRTFSQPKFLALGVCFCDLIYAGMYSKWLKLVYTIYMCWFAKKGLQKSKFRTPNRILHLK